MDLELKETIWTPDNEGFGKTYKQNKMLSIILSDQSRDMPYT